MRRWEGICLTKLEQENDLEKPSVERWVEWEEGFQDADRQALRQGNVNTPGRRPDMDARKHHNIVKSLAKSSVLDRSKHDDTKPLV